MTREATRRARGPRLAAAAALACALGLALLGTGCGTYMARRLAQAPNTYPDLLSPSSPVELAFGSNYLAHFPARFVEVGPPPASLRYRVIEPRDYRVVCVASNWLKRGETHFRFSYHASVPGEENPHTGSPRGTVVLLPSYGSSQVILAPWALRLAQAGWRCVLVDLRGHGKSTGRRIYFGARETADLDQLLQALEPPGGLAEPLVAMGYSYGGAVGLEWAAANPRVRAVVAIAPYAELSEGVLNVRREYAAWVPAACVRAGLKRLPALLEASPEQLDPVKALAGRPVRALLIAGGRDAIAPVASVERLRVLHPAGSRMVVADQATHETIPFLFDELVGPVLDWLSAQPPR